MLEARLDRGRKSQVEVQRKEKISISSSIESATRRRSMNANLIKPIL